MISIHITLLNHKVIIPTINNNKIFIVLYIMYKVYICCAKIVYFVQIVESDFKSGINRPSINIYIIYYKLLQFMNTYYSCKVKYFIKLKLLRFC